MLKRWGRSEAGGLSVGQSDRLAGAVWGHLVGDALGVPYEFRNLASSAAVEWGHSGSHDQPAGTWSDDGGLMLALLDSLLTAGFDLDDQGRRALAWLDGPDYKPGPLFDVGTTTENALSRLLAGTRAELAGGIGERDNGNGSLMRILPVALVGRDLPPKELAARAMRASAVTHRHPRSQVVCALYVLVAQALIRGETELAAALEAAHSSIASLEHPDHRRELASVTAYKQRAGSGYVVDTFWSAWDALTGARDYRDAVVRAIRYGHDTDTTACVAGGLAGIYWGIGGIPQEWLLAMRGRAIVEPLVARLIAD
jgi:ADP-ribosyl-[dinitrogen reductase] hydrolase